MITKIDISNFGLYQDFDWNRTIGPDNTFSKLNIIYGRNYSGKTTISRILKCLEDRTLHCDYDDARFNITLRDGTSITDANIDEMGRKQKVRVFNSDFVKENLAKLRTDEGTITAFTVLGAGNVELEAKIDEVKSEIGSIESGTGLQGELARFGQGYKKKRELLATKLRELETTLQNKAREIKEDTAAFNLVNYNITRIKEDIGELSTDSILDKDTVDSLRRIIKSEKLDLIGHLSPPKLDFKRLEDNVRRLSSAIVKPTKQIQDLISDSALQIWVKSGMGLHREKRSACGFCGSELPPQLWDALDAHFTAESEALSDEIDLFIDQLAREGHIVETLTVPNRELFYEPHRVKYDAICVELNTTKQAYIGQIRILVECLEKRRDSIFERGSLGDVTNLTGKFIQIIAGLNDLIDVNNSDVGNIEQQQATARKQLRLSEVACFTRDLGYESKNSEIAQLQDEVNQMANESRELTSKLDALAKEKARLESLLTDESHGAELVNNYIAGSFGHHYLKLEATGDESKTRFKVVRNDVEARNLSEGECSLIAFCYFVATLRDQLDDETVVFIDDPISSLDSNHIFLIYSLIENKIAAPQKYGQLFVSTHNLEFLKYLKRLTEPVGSSEYFLIERKQKQNSPRAFIARMPTHLKDYVTEFNYLFSEIHKLYKPAKGERKMEIQNTYNSFYNFPNNLRKFLECYLFYRFPNTDRPLSNLERVFPDGVPPLLRRVINEYSHLTFLDRAWLPMDVEEAEQCASLVIEMMKANDQAQFEAFLQSIGAQLN